MCGAYWLHVPRTASSRHMGGRAPGPRSRAGLAQTYPLSVLGHEAGPALHQPHTVQHSILGANTRTQWSEVVPVIYWSYCLLCTVVAAFTSPFFMSSSPIQLGCLFESHRNCPSVGNKRQENISREQEVFDMKPITVVA